MLILTRKKDESFLIGENIRVTIVDIQKNQIRIGIDAPKDLSILREELIIEIGEENQKAVEISPKLLEGLSRLVQTGANKSNDK